MCAKYMIIKVITTMPSFHCQCRITREFHSSLFIQKSNSVQIATRNNRHFFINFRPYANKGNAAAALRKYFLYISI
jgi:hypothetical protein